MYPVIENGGYPNFGISATNPVTPQKEHRAHTRWRPAAARPLACFRSLAHERRAVLGRRTASCHPPRVIRVAAMARQERNGSFSHVTMDIMEKMMVRAPPAFGPVPRHDTRHSPAFTVARAPRTRHPCARNLERGPATASVPRLCASQNQFDITGQMGGTTILDVGREPKPQPSMTPIRSSAASSSTDDATPRREAKWPPPLPARPCRPPVTWPALLLRGLA